ncbi:cytochrome c oxidase biogenesis protein Cmc1 like-domain-containing protein [Hyaloraphidium curvatum]|nr:cytochrome c oxidase biogenesis protein Cmc1 like-domain-containing protein [Hyaloraphidium curvatum]
MSTRGELPLDDTILLYHEEDTVKDRWKRRTRAACDPAIKAFTECEKGRLISVMWACRSLRNEMMDCLKKAATPESYDEVRLEYLRERAEKRARA